MCGVDFTALSLSQRVFAVILEDHIPSTVGLIHDIKWEFLTEDDLSYIEDEDLPEIRAGWNLDGHILIDLLDAPATPRRKYYQELGAQQYTSLSGTF